jgi:hypothetical protein
LLRRLPDKSLWPSKLLSGTHIYLQQDASGRFERLRACLMQAFRALHLCRLGLVSLLKGLSGCFSKALLFDQTLGDACFAPLILHIAGNQRWDRYRWKSWALRKQSLSIVLVN